MKPSFTQRCQLVAWLSLLLSLPSLAQNRPFDCGTDQNMATRLATDSSYRRFFQSLRPNQDKGGVDTTTVFTLPVVFVVYHLGEAVGTGSNIADAALQAQIDLLNRTFSAQQPSYVGADTRIRFALARRTPNCTAFNGIVRVDARSVPGYQSNGVGWTDWQMVDRLRGLVPEYANSFTDRVIVVRVVQYVTGAAGWAAYGGDITVPAGGLLSADTHSTLMTHEMGHALFLPHTFQGSEVWDETGTPSIICPPNNNPEYDGDQVPDTDPHQKWEPANACEPASETLINACTGRPFGLIGRNYMSYGCYTKLFTHGQMVRMRSYFTENLRGLINSPYLNPPAPDELPIAAACPPTTVSATNYHFDGVYRVQFAGLEKVTGASPYTLGRNYFDYSCTERITVTAGQTYRLTVGGRGQFRRVYIDYNNDGSFDEGAERVLTDQITGPPGGEPASSLLLTIPTNTVMDRYLRMRVIIDGGNTAPTACNLPGGLNGSGEAEDYGIRILPTDAPRSLSLGELASAYTCRGASLTVSVLTQGAFDAGNVFTVQLSDATGSFQNPLNVGSGTLSPITVQLPASLPLGNDYRLRVVSSSPALTSFPGPTLTLEDFPTGTISGSQTLLTGQAASLSLSFTGRRPLSFVIRENGQDWWHFDATTIPAALTFLPQASAIYTLGYVRNSCGYGTVAGSVTITVTCSTPTSLNETQVGLYTARFSWQDIPNVVYDIEWKEISATTWNHFEYVYGNAFSVGGMELGKTYQWRVRRWCLDGVSDWTAIRAFTMQCIVPAQPTEQFTETSATLRWQAVSGSLGYQVRSREAGSPTWNQGSLSDNQLIMIGLTAGKVYEWQVQLLCSNGSQSAYTPLRWFTTQCAVPQSGSAVNETPTSVRVNWTGGQTGLRYQVRWRVVGASVWTASDTLNSVTNLLITGLSAYAIYEWQVRSFCSRSQSSDYSATSLFNTNCQPPSGNATNTSTTSVQLGWYTSGSNIDMRWRVVGANTWNLVSGASSGVSSGIYNLTGLATGTTYEWQLQARCPGGAISGFGQSFTFTAQCPPPQGLYESGITASTAMLNWFVTQLTLPATVSWRAVGSATWQTSATLTPTVTSGNTYSYTLTNLIPGTIYEWRALSICPDGATTSSASRTFTAQCAIPTPYNSSNSLLEIVVSYQSNPSTVYQVRWRQVGTASWTESTTTTEGTYRISGLTTGEVYEWQVRSVCSDGSVSGYSASLTMVLSCPMPYANYATQIRPTSALLSWSSMGSTYEIRYRLLTSPTWTTISNIASYTYLLTGLTTGATYEWQVRSVCSGTAPSGYTSSNTFIPTCRLALYLNEGYVLASMAMVQWSTESYMQYKVQWRPMGSATWQESG